MATTWKFYHDAALTQEITALNPLTALQDTAGGIGAVDKVIYLGSTTASRKLQAASNPGVDPVVVSVVDTAAGSGAPDTEFLLSISPITGAETPGAPVNLSHTLFSGTSNAIPIYTRRVSAITVVNTYTDLQLQTNSVDDLAV